VLWEIQNREYALYSKEEGWSHIFRCDETKSWRNDLVDKRFTSVDPEIGIRRVATNKDKDKLYKFGLYLNIYKKMENSSDKT
jgi:hypothetical protein